MYPTNQWDLKFVNHGITNFHIFFQQNPPDNGSLFTSEGLQPSINDLDNLFDDSSDETEGVI